MICKLYLWSSLGGRFFQSNNEWLLIRIPSHSGIRQRVHPLSKMFKAYRWNKNLNLLYYQTGSWMDSLLKTKNEDAEYQHNKGVHWNLAFWQVLTHGSRTFVNFFVNFGTRFHWPPGVSNLGKCYKTWNFKFLGFLWYYTQNLRKKMPNNLVKDERSTTNTFWVIAEIVHFFGLFFFQVPPKKTLNLA